MTPPVQKKLSFEARTVEKASAGAPPAVLPRVRLTTTGSENTSFLRPKVRTRIRRTRRSLLARLILGAQIVAALIVTVGGTALLVAKILVSERLKVVHIDVRGNHYLSEGEVRELLGPVMGENILTLDIDDAKARLGASPWVSSAAVRRALPSGLHIEIKERRPVALAEVERLYLMDGDGTLIDAYGPHTSEFDLPVVRGLSGLGDEARRFRAERAGALLSDLGPRGAEISEVTVESGGDLRAVLRDSGIVVRLGAPPYLRRFEAFLALRRDLMTRTPDAEYFDLRFRDRILAKVPVAKAVAAASPAGASTVASVRTRILE